jgi:hypothetical protein
MQIETRAIQRPSVDLELAMWRTDPKLRGGWRRINGARAAMNEKELRVFDLRGDNRSWNEIADWQAAHPNLFAGAMNARWRCCDSMNLR